MNLVLLLGLMGNSFLVVRGLGKILGPGTWSVVNIMKCEKDDTMVIKIDVNQRKINRTHDGFNAKIILDETLDNTYAIRVDICKYVDGGCKPYQVLADDSFENFAKKHASKNVQAVLSKAKVDPPDFPVSKGVYELYNYLFDYYDLPPECPFGEYGCEAKIIKDGLERGCVYIRARCVEKDKEER